MTIINFEGGGGGDIFITHMVLRDIFILNTKFGLLLTNFFFW